MIHNYQKVENNLSAHQLNKWGPSTQWIIVMKTSDAPTLTTKWMNLEHVFMREARHKARQCVIPFM